MLFNFQCQNPECQNLFEELVSANEANPNCPQCQSTNTEKALANNTASQQGNSVRYWEIRNKYISMKNKMTGKTPWRKSSGSQTD